MAYLKEPVGLVERDARERRFDLDARRAGLDRVGFGFRQKRRTNALSRRSAPHVDRAAMPVTLDAIVAGKPKALR